MERNDATIPTVAIVVAAFFWIVLLFAYSQQQVPGAAITAKVLMERSPIVPGHTGAAAELVDLFLATFTMVLTIYGVMGLYSVWAEGRELVPGVHRVHSGNLPLVAILSAMAMTIFCAVMFVRQIAIGLAGMNTQKPIDVTGEGIFAAGILLFLTVVLGLYKKYFMDSEVTVEDASGEFPW
jgi:hypothetical protein